MDRFAPTTQYCPKCSALNKLLLGKRQYECECGYSEQRDLHAAQNMLRLAPIYGTPAERGEAPVERKASAAPAGNPAGDVSHASVKQEMAKLKISP